MADELTDKELAERLFEYLRDILYSPDKAELDRTGIPADFSQLVEGLLFVGQCAAEQKLFSQKLIKGELDTEPPSVENGLASPLKAIQGTLTHLSWQVHEVTKGDYKQHVDFMGDLGDSVNEMTKQLEERETALKREKENLEKTNAELSSLHELMMDLALGSTRFIVFKDIKTYATVFQTDTVNTFCEEHPQIGSQVLAELEHYPAQTLSSSATWTRDFYPPEDDTLPSVIRFSISSNVVKWHGKDVIAHVLTDDTDNMKTEAAMEELAFTDPLTNLYNRRFAMQRASTFIEEQIPFCLAFVDLDNLKYCNDNFGHIEGDTYITQVAEALSSMPGKCTVARIGGDEFMILSSNRDIEEFTSSLATLRERILKIPVPEGYEYRRSFSYGVIEIPAPADKSLAEYLTDADTKMYEFKYSNKKLLKLL